MKTIADTSFGIIPIKRVGKEWKVFLINQYSKIGNNTYWVFPKGHPEGTEHPLETAKRELKEETGMEAEQIIEEPRFDLQYNFKFNGNKINKTVTFFLGLVSSVDYSLCPDEVKEAGWYTLEEAERRLDYQDTKTMFAKARPYIQALEA
jgi:8-oxo-dGTP pyrophosphatase MutT (NUDIX family)